MAAASIVIFLSVVRRGIWIADGTAKSVRKVNDGETTDDLLSFLTTTPNKEISEIHPRAMPVILTQPEESEAWLCSFGKWLGSCKGRCPMAR